MAYIYKITNNINGKIYIGKTEFSVEKRFKEHCRDSKKREYEKRPLYSAMNKYGIENFSIEVIEETDNPEEREMYWINKLNTYYNGYNATIGGDGKRYLDYDLVVDTYNQLKNMSLVAKQLNICYDSVRKILKQRNIEIVSSQNIVTQKDGKNINQFDINGNYIQTFESIRAAARAVKPNQPDNVVGGATRHIVAVCKGKRKTAYGYIWRYKE